MSVKQKQARERQKAYSDQQLKDRLAFLSEKGITASRADKDPIVRKLKADVRAAAGRLRVIAAHEKKTEELAKMKAEKAAAAKLEKESGKSEKAQKAKKAPEEPKAKKPKPPAMRANELVQILRTTGVTKHKNSPAARAAAPAAIKPLSLAPDAFWLTRSRPASDPQIMNAAAGMMLMTTQFPSESPPKSARSTAAPKFRPGEKGPSGPRPGQSR